MIHIVRSKTDPEGEGRDIGIPYGQHPQTCPVRALRAWLAAADFSTGALFSPVDRHDRIAPTRLTDKGVARIVQRACRRAGIDPTGYPGHSLRSGLATSAGKGGAPEWTIMRQTGHGSERMVRKYIRAGTLFEENAAAYTGL